MNKTIQARVTDDQFEIVEKKAAALGLSISNYVRMVCLKADISINIYHQSKDTSTTLSDE